MTDERKNAQGYWLGISLLIAASFFGGASFGIKDWPYAGISMFVTVPILIIGLWFNRDSCKIIERIRMLRHD